MKGDEQQLSSSGVGRTIHVCKRKDFDGYGFNLHAEKGKSGQYIGKVDDGSPAAAAGLRQGDRIIEVNSVNIGAESHKQVVQRIKTIANEVRMLVVDADVEVDKDNCIVAVNLSTPKMSERATTNGNGTNTNGHHDGDSMSSSLSPTIIAAKVEPVRSASPKEKERKAAVEVKPPQVPSVQMTIEKDQPTTNGKQKELQKHQQQQQQTSEVDGQPAAMGNGGGNAAQVDAATAKLKDIHLQMTVAEMRAKLAANKKFNPKFGDSDIRKKFEIVQKL